MSKTEKNKAEKNSSKLETIRWLCFVPALIMYFAVREAFGTAAAMIAAAVFGMGFFAICSRGRMRVICEEIVSDISETLEKMGHDEIFFEVKKFSPGFVIRVYLIRARNSAPMYKKAILDRLNRGWYKRHVLAAQVVDIEGVEDVKEAQRMLNSALLEDLKRKLKDGSGDKDKPDGRR